MSKRSLEEDIHKKFLRLRYNIEGLCRKYERMSKEEDASLELNCTTGEWVQVVKPGKKPLNDVQVKDKLRELDFTKDLVCSSASVGNITDERVKVRVLKHNKRFERYYEKAKEGDNDSEDDENDYFCSQFDDDDNEMTPQLPNIDFSNSEAEEEDSCDEIEEEDKENEPKTSKNKN
ncbi:hypothetical protein FO519_007341 [Halicephalobus sp. NKZ332]|nr:hypothetical protein FO519_007341 [Halicephalobus sp. NKZ332]